jgi:DNA topoisomerase IB
MYGLVHGLIVTCRRRDEAKGRKQHRYHPRWREVRDQTKFDRMTAFGRVLPGLPHRRDHSVILLELLPMRQR